MTKIFTKKENQSWAHSLPGKMCSACLILISNNKVLMVKARYKDHWTFPGGIVDDKESPESAALRETREETGLSVTAASTLLQSTPQQKHPETVIVLTSHSLLQLTQPT